MLSTKANISNKYPVLFDQQAILSDTCAKRVKADETSGSADGLNFDPDERNRLGFSKLSKTFTCVANLDQFTQSKADNYSTTVQLLRHETDI